MKRGLIIGGIAILSLIVLVMAVSTSNFGNIVASGNINATNTNQTTSTHQTIRLNIDPANHNITDNSTCIIMRGDTSVFEVC